jgi:hypothetical protein
MRPASSNAKRGVSTVLFLPKGREVIESNPRALPNFDQVPGPARRSQTPSGLTHPPRPPAQRLPSRQSTGRWETASLLLPPAWSSSRPRKR